jgi:hypothetical protein
MKKPKPQVAVVFGILHMVFGGLGIFCNLCGIGSLVAMYVLMTTLYQQAGPAEKKELEELWQKLNESVPGLLIYVFADQIGRVLLGIVLLIAGIGLMGVKNWARHLSVVWAIVRIGFLLGLLVYNVMFVSPGLHKFNEDFEKWQERMEKRSRGTGQPTQKPAFGGGLGGTGNPVVDNILAFGGTAMYCIYAVVVLIFMLKPATVQAFLRYHSVEEDYALPQQAPMDYYDDDYERRRRELGPPESPPPLPPPGDYRPPGDSPPPRDYPPPGERF